MNSEQLIRIDKTYNEPLYLLDTNKIENKLVYKISGSTNNIYNVQIYFNSRKIYCNCPDSKKWARIHNVICKHCCFILLKVFKMSGQSDFFDKYILSNEQLEELKIKTNNLNLSNNNEFVNQNYIQKFKELTNNPNNNKNIKTIVLKENYDNFCPICYDEFTDITNIVKHIQCKQCMVILHKVCLQKWLNMGKSTCPYCRITIKSETNNFYKNLFE
jgi:hypothetical protein